MFSIKPKECKRNSGSSKRLAYRVRLARRLHGYSLKEIADYLGVHEAQVSRLENGINHLSDDRISALAKLYEVDVAWFSKENVGIVVQDADVTLVPGGDSDGR